LDGAQALNQFLPLVYHPLHELARDQRRRWSGDETLNTTALVHEAYLRLVGHSTPDRKNRAHFLSVASRAMRHIMDAHTLRCMTLSLVVRDCIMKSGSCRILLWIDRRPEFWFNLNPYRVSRGCPDSRAAW
jgi:hypothetical protein